MTKGILIPIGGGEDKRDEKAVLERFLYEIGKKDPKIEIITAATSLPREVGRDYSDAFDSLGSRNYDVMDIRSAEEADDNRMIERLKEADGVFFTGGDQTRIMDVFSKTKFLDILKERYRTEPFVIAGTSAGCAAMPEFMIQGGTTEDAIHKGEIRITSGLGLISGVVFDTHFTERGRFARLMNIVGTNPNLLCMGFGEDTAAMIKNNLLSVFGSGVVSIIDGSQISYSTVTSVKAGDPITIEKLIVHLLAQGETFDVNSKDIKKQNTENTVVVDLKANKWEVRTKDDKAVLFSTDEKEAAVKFAKQMGEQHKLKVTVMD